MIILCGCWQRMILTAGLSALAVILSGCVIYTARYPDTYRLIADGQFEAALDFLDRQVVPERDQALYQLDRATVLHGMGHYQESNRYFEAAKQRMLEWGAVSVLENAAALSINESLRQYIGQPYERLLLHAYMAMNYLALQQYNEARVEVLQADVEMREWASTGNAEAVRSSAFMRYLSGLVFEATHEPDQALVAYRKAYEVLQDAARPVPWVLQQDLLRLSRLLKRDAEYQHYAKQFTQEAQPVSTKEKYQGELIFILGNGLVPLMQEQVIAIFSGELKKDIFLALPYYPPGFSDQQWIGNIESVYVSDAAVALEVFEDLDILARQNLDDRMPGLTTRGILRVIAKHKWVHEIDKESGMLGFVAAVANDMVERADVRSWSSLPARLSVARVWLPVGQRVITFRRTDGYSRIVNIDIKAGEKVFLFDADAALKVPMMWNKQQQ